MKKVFFITLFLFFNFFPLTAIEGLRFENITNKNGLSHNTVRSVMQDRRGFLWISTINGLNRYDGYRFILMQSKFGAFSLSENNVRNTIEDHNGRLWVQTTSRFVDCYDTHTESFVDYTGKGKGGNYRKIEVREHGDVWLWGNENGACRIQYREGEMISTLYDINNIGTNEARFVIEDLSGQVWIGTDKGLLQIINNVPRYCNTGCSFHNFHSAVELEEAICFFTNNNAIIIFDKKRNVFLPSVSLSSTLLNINDTEALDNNKILVTSKTHALIFDALLSEFIPLGAFFDGEEPKSANIITDNKGFCWIYNKSGNVWRYRPEFQRFEKYRLIPSNILSLIDSERYDIYCDSRDITWISTFGNGLFAIEKTGQVNHFTVENSGLNTNYLLSVSEDNSGEIWVGTEHTGISKISLTKYYNQVFIPNPDKTESADKTIRSIYENHSDGNIWIGTKSGEVYLFDENFSLKKSFSLREGVPYCITTDTTGNTWIGTKGNGILIIPENNYSLNNAHSILLSDDNKTGTNNIYSILCDRKGRMWIGSFGGGLFLCEHVNDTFRITPFSSVSNKQRQIRCMIEDRAGLIWAGGENGIVVFNPDSLIDNNEQFHWLRFDKNNPRSLNNNVVKAIFEDSHGRIWAGTSGGGLNMTVKDTLTGNIEFRHYTSEDGLVNNMVQAVLEDGNQILWVSTESGISKFDVANVIFENYNFPDSWESELFCESSATRRKKGELLFGSHNGMYIFNPSLSENRTYALPVMITGLSINGIPVGPDSPDSPLAGSITEIQNIRLENGQNSFSIEFSSLNFQNSHSDRYTYILENYDKEWNPVTQYNVATYKNIPAGEYVFKVKKYNNSGKRDYQEAHLGIVVVPPFWKSMEAFILYVVLCIVIVFFSVRLIVKMNKLHNEVEIEKQLTEFRMRFFTNISHEFRTPLTIIRGSIESINALDSLSFTLKKHVKTLDRSSSKLMHLINQLLEFRKMQNDRMDLRLEYTDIVSFMREVYDMFAETAERKQIQFTFSSDRESKMILLDRGKMEKIVFNLLSNAFKHTPDDGNVALNIVFEAHDNILVLSVSDSGIGIPPEKEHLLFVRFGQINYSSSGIGIGLHLTSEFTRLHKGEIKYEKSEWGGARFIVSIPVSADSYNPEDIVDSSKYTDISDVMEMSGIAGLPAVADLYAVTDNNEKEVEDSKRAALTLKYKVLIIEDDEEIRLFLEDQLDKFFVIRMARDGLTGWETAMREQPNLIVCDVMMPGMNGFEVTRKLKSDFQTSHIPIIMLTAHSSMEHQLEGINAGADSYIIKPFSLKYLISRIVKLIEQRERLQDKFAHEPNMTQTIICTSNKDNEFIEKVHSIIEKHLDDADFSVDDFSKAANMGRTIFYKKIKGITNFSPNEYLRIIRLKKATELLKGTEFNISEIAYKVGFNDPFYFSKCFKEQFGMKPTQFRENEKNKRVV